MSPPTTWTAGNGGSATALQGRSPRAFSFYKANLIRRIYQWSGQRPQFWSEFYYTAEAESNVSGRLDVATQSERGRAYRNYVENAAGLGFVVGVEWFTLIDQAVSGRFFEKYNGERQNTGLFNVCDRPYRDCLAEMTLTHRRIYDVWLDGEAPYVFDHPRFTGGPGDTVRTVRAGHTVGPMMQNQHSGAELWSADGLELFVGSEALDQAGPLRFSDRQILIGAGKRDGDGQFHVVNAPRQPDVTMAVVPAAAVDGYTLEVAIPWSVVGVKPQECLELLFDVAVDDSSDGKSRNCQLTWNGTPRNSADRGPGDV